MFQRRGATGRVRTAIVVAACAAGSLAIVPQAAVAATITAPGSIVYVKNGDVHLITPDGSAQRQVTHDGNSPTGDATGDTGYRLVSESDDGLIVAVRNQEFNAGLPNEYTQGFLWELDRSGNVIRKFKPAQFDYIPGGGCTPSVQELPLGIVNAAVSPDGQYVAYTAETYVQNLAPSCMASQGYSSWIVKADGTGAAQIAESNGFAASIEIGQWTADSSTLLADRADFGSIQDFTVSVPGSTAVPWTAPPGDDYIDQAYGQPAVRQGILATEGYSEYATRNAMRLWTTSGFDADPIGACEYTSPVADGETSEFLSRPSLAPDASYVVWEDSDFDGGVAQTGQGIYLLATSTITNGCTTPSTLFIPGGEDPFWTAAGIYEPPSVSFTGAPPAFDDSASAHIQFTATDPDPSRHILGYTCSLDDGPAAACTSPQSYSGLADGRHTLEVVADDGAQTGSARLSWRVDTVAPHAALTAPSARAKAATATRVAWAGSDAGSGVAHYQVRFRRASYSHGFGRWATPTAWRNRTGHALIARGLRAGFDYCWSVRAVDRAGNTGPWSAPRCMAIALDDRALTTSRGWHRGTGRAFYAHTVTTSSRHGARLTRTGASVARVGVLATTCRSCGKVVLLVGKHRIGTVNLHSSRTHHKVIKLLPAFRLRSGAVIVKVASAGKPVAIDGLILSRT